MYLYIMQFVRLYIIYFILFCRHSKKKKKEIVTCEVMRRIQGRRERKVVLLSLFLQYLMADQSVGQSYPKYKYLSLINLSPE